MEDSPTDVSYEMPTGGLPPSIAKDKLVEALNKGIINSIQKSGKTLPSSSVSKLADNSSPVQCEWTEFSTELCNSVVEDLRQYFPHTLEGQEFGSEGRPMLYAACLGLLLSKREGEEDIDDSKDDDSKKDTPLSTFISIASFLVDECEVDPNQPTFTKSACHRPPLHLLAKACYPSAVHGLLARGANPNMTDDEGWTAIMAVCLPDIAPGEEGGPTVQERVDTLMVLLKGNNTDEYKDNIDVNAHNYVGYTALHYACEGLNYHLIECLLKEGGADSTLLTIWGQSCLGIIKVRSFESPEDAAKCEAIILQHLEENGEMESIRSFVDEESKSIELMNLVGDVLIPASRPQESDKNGSSGEGQSSSSQDERIITALLKYIKMDPKLLYEKEVFEQYPHEEGNLYEVIHKAVMELVPRAYRQVYKAPPNDEHRQIITGTQFKLRKVAEKFVNEEESPFRRINTDIAMQEAFKVHRERGKVANQLEILNDIIVRPLQHTLAFGTPSNDVLKEMIAHSPNGIVEMGAGTGYWSFVLSKLGADIVAYDARPNEENGNEYFDSQSYFRVKQGDAATVFKSDTGNSDRALLLVWPNNPDSEDNKHVAVEGPALPDIWDIDCLKRYYESGGDTVIYVGERESEIELMDWATDPDCGFCSSRKFQTFLQYHYELKADLKCPQWWMKEDDCTIWKRK